MTEGYEAIGLCAHCRYGRVVSTPRSRFWLCERSRREPEYPRYPRLPVRECAGYEPRRPGEESPEGPPRS